MQMLLVHETLRSLFLSRIFTQYLDLLETMYLKIECTKTKQPAVGVRSYLYRILYKLSFSL